MDCSFGLFTKIMTWGSFSDEAKCSNLHVSIIRDYYNNISKACTFEDSFDRIFGQFQMIRLVFMVPKQSRLQQSQQHIKKYLLVEAFLSFLLKLLYYKTDLMVDSCKDRLFNLEKELRFLLTILGHTSLVLCEDELDSEQVQKLLEEFEAVANEAGSFLASLLFSTDKVSEKTDRHIDVVLHHIELLNGRIMEFLNPTVSYHSRQACRTSKALIVDSFLFLDSVFCYLKDLVERKDNRVVDLIDQIKILYDGLKVLKSSIEDVGSLQPSETGEFKQLVMQIGDMAHEAEYLIVSFLVGDAPSWYLVSRLAKVSYKIEVIGTRFQEIEKENKHGSSKVSSCLSMHPSSQERKNSEVNNVIVGFDAKEEEILGQLDGGTERLQVISIFGMAGLGKTTLAKKLYDHPNLNYRFDIASWCVISQKYRRRSVLIDMWMNLTRELGNSSIKAMDEESLVVHIFQALKLRRYFIVLDDIWDWNVWEDLQRCFPNDNNASRILLTTRNKDVVPSDSIKHALPSLSDKQCWELLEKKVFGSRSCPQKLRGIGEKIAANCRGLPLAVVVTAGILSAMTEEIDTWEQVCGNVASRISGGDNSVMRVLELSYKHLPQRLKPCFLYFGLLREGKEILVGKLMRLWIAEGFIRKEEGKSAENVAEKYLMELIDKSLVMIAKNRSDGGAKTCALHDLLRDLCWKKSEEENFLKFVKNDTLLVHERGHRIHVAHHHNVSAISCQYTRSLHGVITSNFHVRDMRLLRVFNCDSPVRSNLSGIEYLINLRYLIISELPPGIDKLENLEYLNLSSFTVVYLPTEVMKMRKLRYIQATIGMTYEKDCSCSETSNLEFLSRFWIIKRKDEEMLKCSPHLRKLKCRCSPFSSKDKGEKEFVDLTFLTQLESLKIGPYSVDHMKGISFPSNIKKLTLFRGPKDKFYIDSEMMSVIGRLVNLEVLKLRSISFEDKRWETKDDEFEKLRYLKLCEVGDLDEWNVESTQHFRRLQRLVLKDCKNLVEVPSEIGEIPTLEMIEIQGRCTKSLVKSAKEIQKEQLENENKALRIVITVQSWLRNAGGSSSSG